jgi:acetyltransferase
VRRGRPKTGAQARRRRGGVLKTRALDKLLDPHSIAVIGASNTRGSVGQILLRNLITAEHPGVVFPVHRSATSVHGIQAYPSIAQVPRKIDLAVIAVPASSVPDVIHECGEEGVGGAVIVSSGFKESGPEGRALEEKVVGIARSYDLRVLGPNCIGFLRPGRRLNATFSPVMPEQGRVCFITQSGALGTAVLDLAATNSIGLSAFVSVGSMCDVDFGDLIDYFGADAQTNSIILYLEALSDARTFMRAARHFAKTKPIILVKSSRTARSALAAAAHIGSGAGDDTLYSAAFRRAGVVRVDEVANLFAASEAIARVPSPRGPRLGVVTNAGGPGVMAVDRLLQLDGDLAELAPETAEKLKATLPAFASIDNPVDIGDDADADRFATATRALLTDPNCDGVLAIFAPYVTSPARETASSLIAASREFPGKPLLAAFLGGDLVSAGLQALHGAHVPAFSSPEDAVSAYMNMHERTRSLATLYQTPADILPHFEPDRDRVKAIFTAVAAQGHDTLTETEAKEVLSAYGVPVIETLTATSPQECGVAARQIGLPVTVKVLSRDIANKAAVRALALDVRSVGEATRQYGRLLTRLREAMPDAEVLGVTVHSMSRRGHDVVVGSWRDETFGPVLFLSPRDSGGTVSDRLAVEFPPLNQALAHALIDEVRVPKLFRPDRLGNLVDRGALEQVMVKLSYLLVDFPEIVRLEASPLQVRADGVEVLDASITIEPKDVRKIARPGSHLIISMYPSKYEQTVTLDGHAVTIRAIRPEDEPLWAEMIASLSDTTAGYRFFGPVTEITKPTLVRYCHIDYDSEISLVTIDEGREPKMLGVASLAIDEPGGDRGEFAIVVRDDIQRRGLGTRLMTALIDAARDKYVREITGDVLASNAPMISFVESLGFKVEPSEEPTIRRAVLHL